jgi:hypothetical protein
MLRHRNSNDSCFNETGMGWNRVPPKGDGIICALLPGRKLEEKVNQFSTLKKMYNFRTEEH